ncbi:MAG: GTP 3',8-cyclase MoaA [Deltaproteobacteria bacterium]|nr:GTP 3',8-cyclase MoaA [Deltaproteobacteria bacterium]
MTPVTDLLQRPLHDLRVSVTDKCNFRCPYCMPAEVYGDDYEFSPKAEILTFEEIERLSRLFVGAGVRKIRITGGEPLIRKDLPELLRRLSGLEGLRDLTLTTNGWFLAQQAKILRESGLNRVTVSLDSLDDAVFGRMNGRGYGVARVLEGIEAAKQAGLAPVKVNAVVKRTENLDSVVALAGHFRGTGVTVRYIEFMDVGNRNGWRMDEVVPAAEVVSRISAQWPLEPVAPEHPGEVATRFRYRDGAGEIGVIASITEPFCGGCSRARLTTDGRLVTCLFAATGPSLRDPMRAGATDAELFQRIAGTWSKRRDRYSEERTENTPLRQRRKIEMYQIGG